MCLLTSTVDEDVNSTHSFDDCLFQIQHLLIFDELAVNDHSLAGVTLSDQFHLLNISSNKCDACTMVEIPKGETAPNTRRRSSDDNRLVVKVFVSVSFRLVLACCCSIRSLKLSRLLLLLRRAVEATTAR